MKGSASKRLRNTPYRRIALRCETASRFTDYFPAFQLWPAAVIHSLPSSSYAVSLNDLYSSLSSTLSTRNANAILATSFFLGMLFALFPYDYPILWTNPTGALAEAFNLYETHLSTLHASPPLITRIFHMVISLGLGGFFWKLYKPSESNMLFDGASLVLYVCAITMYLTNTVRGLKVVGERAYETKVAVDAEMAKAGDYVEVSREEGLSVLAATNAILALMLLGVLVLQCGQWYADRKQKQEEAAMRGQSTEKKKAKVAGEKKKA